MAVRIRAHNAEIFSYLQITHLCISGYGAAELISSYETVEDEGEERTKLVSLSLPSSSLLSDQNNMAAKIMKVRAQTFANKADIFKEDLSPLNLPERSSA